MGKLKGELGSLTFVRQCVYDTDMSKFNHVKHFFKIDVVARPT